MRGFKLIRDEDVSGVSGIGVVAEGGVVSDGRVILAWLGQYPTMEELPSVAALEAIHGHGGRTRVVFDKVGGG